MRRENEIYCNRCKKQIKSRSGIAQEGLFHAETDWGYFSEKDGERHSFDLCEDCYDEITEAFAIPVERVRLTELL